VESTSSTSPTTGRRSSGHRAVWAIAIVVALVAAAGFSVGRATHHSSDAPQARTTGAAGRPASVQSDGQKKAPSSLLVVETTDSWATPAEGNTYDLHLRGADVLWFQDRPGRDSGRLSEAQLGEMWPQLFAGDPPNGSVVAGVRSGEPPAVVITDVSYDRATDTLTARLRLDEGQPSDALDALAQLDAATASTNGRTTLFVDDIYLETIGGCVLNEGGDAQCDGWQVPPGTNLSGGMNLEYSSFVAADFQGIDLSGSYVYQDNFQYANLAGANLSGADVSGANFTNANLTGVNWTGTLWCQNAVGAVEAGCVPYPSG
jgi:Pentapeptide repeats (8 copies)